MISYQLRQREYLLQISRAMTSRLDLPSLLRQILTNAGDLVRAEAGLIALRHGQTETLTVQASYGIPATMLSRFAPLLAEFPPSWPGRDTTVRAEEYGIPNLEARVHLVARAIRLPLHQVIALPLTVADSPRNERGTAREVGGGERLLGVIYLFRSGSIAFSANDESVLGSFADQAAIAVRNAQLYQQVTAEKQQLDAIIEHGADGVMILDPELRIQVFNRALSQMSGWPAEQALGRPCYQVMALENASGRDLCGTDLTAVAFAQSHGVGGEADKPWIVEGELCKPGGSRIVVRITYSPLYDEDDRLSHVLANVVDITRFREAEEMKSTFISVVSHELKTPVSLIKGYANTLAREDANWDIATLREGLQVINEESDRLNGLINNLLDASRIQAGGFKLERSHMSIPRLAEKVVATFQLPRPSPPVLPEANGPEEATGQVPPHHFVLDFPKEFPIVFGDEERLRQVFNNLISNAIKYAPEGGEIRVGGWVDGSYVTIYVADQGIGIPHADQGRLFQRFYRVDSSLRRQTQGAGLGLYLCRSVVEAHGGRIWLRSEPGKGTTVFFTLPVDDAPDLSEAHGAGET